MWILNYFFSPDISKLERRYNVRGLISALRYSRDWLIRNDAAKALGRIRDPRGVNALIATLKDKQTEVRQQAAFSLRSIEDPRAVDPLLELLKGETDEYVLKAAAGALAEIGDPRAIKALLDLRYRLDLTEMLARFDDPQVINPLMDALRTNNLSLQAAAIVGLKKFNDPRAVEAVDGAIELIIASLGSKDSNLREKAALALTIIADARSIKPLIAALKDSNDTVRSWAADALGKIGDVAAIDPLIEVLHSDPITRDHAARALGKIGDERVIEHLVSAVKKDVSDSLTSVSCAAWPLGQMHNSAAAIAIKDLARELSEIAKSAEAATRLRAVKFLGELGPAAAVAKDTLIEMLADETPIGVTRGGLGPIWSDTFAGGVIGTTPSERSTSHIEIANAAATSLGTIFDDKSDQTVVRALLAIHEKRSGLRDRVEFASKQITGDNFIDDFERCKNKWLRKDKRK